MTMHLGHVEIPVSDPARSRRFYTEILGFDLVADQGGEFIWVKSGAVELLLRPGADGGAPGRTADAAWNLVLYTDDLAAAQAALADGGVEMERRGNCLYFRDPDGHWIQLVDPHDEHSGT